MTGYLKGGKAEWDMFSAGKGKGQFYPDYSWNGLYPYYMPRQSHKAATKQWFGCTTKDCRGKWCDGNNPPTICKFCEKPTTFDNPLPSFGRSAGKGKGKGKGTDSGKGKGKGSSGDVAKGSGIDQGCSQADKMESSQAAVNIINELLAKGNTQLATQISTAYDVELPTQQTRAPKESDLLQEFQSKQKQVEKLQKEYDEQDGRACNLIQKFNTSFDASITKLNELGAQLEVATSELDAIKQRFVKENKGKSNELTVRREDKANLDAVLVNKFGEAVTQLQNPPAALQQCFGDTDVNIWAQSLVSTLGQIKDAVCSLQYNKSDCSSESNEQADEVTEVHPEPTDEPQEEAGDMSAEEEDDGLLSGQNDLSSGNWEKVETKWRKVKRQKVQPNETAASSAEFPGLNAALDKIQNFRSLRMPREKKKRANSGNSGNTKATDDV